MAHGLSAKNYLIQRVAVCEFNCDCETHVGDILDKCPIAENHFTSCLLHCFFAHDLITANVTLV